MGVLGVIKLKCPKLFKNKLKNSFVMCKVPGSVVAVWL